MDNRNSSLAQLHPMQLKRPPTLLTHQYTQNQRPFSRQTGASAAKLLCDWTPSPTPEGWRVSSFTSVSNTLYFNWDITHKSPLPLTDPRDALPHAHRAVQSDVDGQCDKLVTDDDHQFTTLTIYVSWQYLSLFNKNAAISETKGQGWKAIRTQWRKDSDILTSTLAAILFSSHPKRAKGSRGSFKLLR